MADNNIVFKVVVDDNGVITRLSSINKDFKDIDLSAKTAVNSASKVTKELKKIGGGNIPKKIKLTKNEINKLNLELKKTSESSGAATSSAMELSRVISDAPYGIRGMANNITQLVSQLGYQANATDKVTGKTVGYVGAVKGMIGALTGPLGVVFAITAVISIFDFLYGANKKAETSTDDLKSSFEDLASVMRNNINASIEDYINLMKVKSLVDKVLEDNSERAIEIEKRLI